MAERVLITTVDLEPAVRLRDAFEAEGYGVELLTPGERIADVPDPALLILTGGLDQKQARRLAREAVEYDWLPVIALVDSPKEATQELRFRLGASDFIQKPIDPADVVLIGRRLVDRRRLREVTGIVGETEAMREVMERVVQISPVNSTVLITGESGTGKERIARGVHMLSPRRNRPFVAANVAALPETLLESELFGHEKGSFTGATAQRKGYFELADKGTLFLDEIGEMPMTTQAKLLRVLEEREFMRVGGEQEISLDVRVIAATNQNLRYLVDAGRFRRDLYYRLNVLHIDLPPLRERRADIPLLIESFIRQASKEHDRPPVVISPESLAILMQYDWPGNVREIKNLVESMVVLAPGRIIAPQDIPQEIRTLSPDNTKLLPAPMLRVEDGGAPAPELEFIFRTLIQMRVDIDDLRRQFQSYQRNHPELPASEPVYHPMPLVPSGRSLDVIAPGPDVDDASDEEDVIVFRPGMTIQTLEKDAIVAALKSVAGNRRKAAEMLGMGERTLYRKIKEYGIPL
ncbi:MAG TPA: sigma-54 dependent transcriptional regulator [Longimicrobiales bacterium]|nr:sigma-54 dependent transcriptional regulator [Longimicrobiales bacterium]